MQKKDSAYNYKKIRIEYPGTKESKELIELLYELKIGTTLSFKNKNESYTKVPGGWVFRFSERGHTCCCFIPFPRKECSC